MKGKDLPEHVAGLLAYLSQSKEKANDDRVANYFRHLYGEDFKRQNDARNADGYVAGSFLLEMKGAASDWHAGLLQGLAYGKFLDFSAVVVITKGFLVIWRVDSFSPDLLREICEDGGAPSQIGERLAQKYSSLKKAHLELACWRFSPELLAPSERKSSPQLALFADERRMVLEVAAFEKHLRAQKRVRLKVTPRNFTDVLREMIPFFEKPLGAVRAFYSILFEWRVGSSFEVGAKHHDRAALGGEQIVGLVPDRREGLKVVIEKYEVRPGPGDSLDDFFAHYDRALDTVDPGFRQRHGIFFTDLDLSKFALWLAKRHVEDLGKNYLVIDPACGSGNLITNWRSPLELRHKVVSDIEPELLFAVERRMSLDSWHDGKFTVVPKVGDGQGLNFLDVTAFEYLDTLTEHMREKGHRPDRPIAFLCNPPYRSDDDQSTAAISYDVDPSIAALTGPDASSERYCCFLAQMKLICQAAKKSGLPGDSLVMLFTKSTWMTDRAVFRTIRREMLSSFQLLTGVLVNGKEFFDLKGKFPVAFTVWRFKEERLDADRPVTLTDLTWVRKADLKGIPWSDPFASDAAGSALLGDKRAIRVALGVKRQRLSEWLGLRMMDFKRERRKGEPAPPQHVGGLPLGAPQAVNKKAYGEADGAYIGFMDKLIPCRVSRTVDDVPWFCLDDRFMAVRKTRCFSGPPDHYGYCAKDLPSTEKLFLWFALGRTLASHGSPMWADALNLWPPQIDAGIQPEIDQIVFAIGLAENECVETWFPADNPVKGAPAAYIRNPMSLHPTSFWSTTLGPHFGKGGVSPQAKGVVDAVRALYSEWAKEFRAGPKLTVSYERPYFIGRGILTVNSGIVQIKDFADEKKRPLLRAAYADVQAELKALRSTFHEMLLDEKVLNYFAEPKVMPSITKAAPPPSRAPSASRRRR